MDSYSHGPFEVSGYHVIIENPEMQAETIMNAWKHWFTANIGSLVQDAESTSMHAIYYNYQNPLDLEKKGYEMLIGYITKTGTVQSDAAITTVEIPAQDYQYTTVSGGFPESVFSEWNKINMMTITEVPRTFAYDLDMYNEDGTELTIAVAVTA